MACKDSHSPPDDLDADDDNFQFNFPSTNNYDYSSYWKNIPDPPTPIKTSTTSSAVMEVIGASATGVVTAPAVSRSLHRQDRRKRHSFALRDVTNHPPVILKCDSNVDATIIGKQSISFLGDGNNCTIEQRTEKPLRRNTTLLSSDNLGAESPVAVTNCQGNDIKSKNSERIECTNMESMVHLVRKYYSVPHMIRIHVANEIESLSGYPMPGYVTNTHYTRSKEEFIIKVQPIVQALEERKQLDALEAEESTQCRATKVGKEGFCYHDVGTGEQIEAEEYKLRYGAMLDEKRRKRKLNATDKDCDNERCRRKGGVVTTTRREAGVCGSNYGMGCIVNEISRNEAIDDSNMDMDEGISMEESIISIDDSEVQANASHSKKNKSLRDTTTSPSDEESASNDTASLFEIDPSDGVGAENDQHEFNHHYGDVGSSTPHPAALLGMPSSNNPRVLVARTRLWLAIDRALAAYSKEILEIQGGGDK